MNQVALAQPVFSGTEPREDVWATGAFGLAVRSTFSSPSLAGPVALAREAPVAHVGTLPRRVAEAMWPAEEAQRLVDWRPAGGAARWQVEHHPLFGYRLLAPDGGIYLVSAGGRRILFAPGAQDSRLWERLLTEQVLPLAAALSGYEVLNAGAIAVQGGAVVLAGEPAAVERTMSGPPLVPGGRLLSGKVAVLSVAGEVAMIHPGSPAPTSIAGEAPCAAPLRALYCLSDGTGGEVRIEPARGAARALVLDSRFAPFVAMPDRWRTYLRVMDAIARRVPIFRISVPSGTDVLQLRAYLQSHLASRPA